MPTDTRFYGPALLPTSPTTLFTAAAGESVVQLIHIMNQSVSSADLTLSVGTDGSATRIYDGFPLRAKEMRAIPTYLVLAEGEVLQGFSGSASSILLTVSGVASNEVIPETNTSVARISLASGTTPSSSTGHQINVRARVTSGAGTIRAALYEGSNNRSGDLESLELTTSLADYALTIAEVDAATITDYSNLEVRIWGHATGSVVFEVGEISLLIPDAAEGVYGEGIYGSGNYNE